MLSAAVFALSLTAPTSGVADYFPLTPGTKWVYQETVGKASGTVTDIVKPPVEVNGELAFPVESRIEGVTVETVLYRISGDTVWIVAYDPKKPLESPRPSFRSSESKTDWDYQGTIPYMTDPVPVSVKGSSEVKGKRKILDAERECLEVRIEARVGPPDQNPVTTRQTAIYAKGVGLAEMHTKTTIGRKNQESKLKLIEFTQGKP